MQRLGKPIQKFAGTTRVLFSLDIFLRDVLTRDLRFGDENGYECEIWLKVFSRILKKNRPPPESFIVLVDSSEKLALFSILKEVKPCFYHKMVKLPTFDNVFSPLPYSS